MIVEVIAKAEGRREQRALCFAICSFRGSLLPCDTTNDIKTRGDKGAG